MEFKDNRTDAQKNTHVILVAGLDRFMSGWGRAAGGHSWAVWACEPHNAENVFNWVNNRPEMEQVDFVDGNFEPAGNGLCHIYVVNDGHPATLKTNEEE